MRFSHIPELKNVKISRDVSFLKAIYHSPRNKDIITQNTICGNQKIQSGDKPAILEEESVTEIKIALRLAVEEGL